ncbi:MAG: hypothetical protein EBR89_02945 [Betaproteobacteria bacterium]|nr:hypothetical protein [Betaproteobacteria bacterium]
MLVKMWVTLWMLLATAAGFAQTAPPVKLALIEGLSGANANGGEAVYRNILWAVERVNARGGVKLAGGAAVPMVLERYDSKGQTEEALSSLRAAIDSGARFILQGNSSATASALIEAVNKHNEREPGKRVVFLNYSAVDPALTNEKCSFEGKFYTFYGNALGAPAALGEAGVGKVLAVADWLPNVQGAASEAFYKSFRTRFPRADDDYVHMRMQLMVEALAQSVEAAAKANPAAAGMPDLQAVALELERARVSLGGQSGAMRASDHQFQQALVVGQMERQGAPGVRFDVEGSGFGFKVIKTLTSAQAEQATTCKMVRPL